VELRYGETGYPELVFGNKGNPKFWKTYMHFPKNNGTPVTPGAIEIVNATKRHHRSLRFQDTYATWDEDDDGAALSDVVLERVSMVEEVPVSCFLHTYLYLPEKEKEGSD